ncbi:GNAT family N-acetyltransferase [Phytomonospora sp. NPDC050363]|uniref:GNAT family N-acetyltransferase n=1 Tax=Phytomonospora sp. NPDC050363 TaxID=3155642 RepID=UPI0033EA7249
MSVEFRLESYDGPAAQELIAEVQQEYVRRYGGPDETVLTAADFAAPNGVFFVAYLDGEPAATGAWRAHGDADAEMKRLYVRPAARGLGLARRMVAVLEDAAREAGRRRMILETGGEQPEAISLYTSMGYAAIEPFGFYAEADGALHFGRVLAAEDAVTSAG